jgi:3-deoxy-D-manno-octulosonic-acid transferase
MIIYCIFLRGLLKILPLAAVFSPKVRHFLTVRKNEKLLLKAYSKPKGITYWFHCASLGEYEQAKPIISTFLNQKDISIVVSFFSPSGYDIVKPKQDERTYITFLPLEVKSEVTAFLNTIQPDKVFWVKYEFWAVVLNQIFVRNVPAFLVSANFNSSHLITKFWAKPWRRLVNKFDLIFVQNELSKEVLQKLGIDCIVSGDTRFDNVRKIAKSGYINKKVELWKHKDFVIVAGSSWQQEEEIVINWLKKGKDRKAIIAPHDVSVSHIQHLIFLLKKAGVSFSLWGDEIYPLTQQVILLDEIGHLSKVYNFADIALVGGGYRNGLHNILEPLAWGKKVITGPNIDNNWEAKEAKKKGLLYVCSDTEEFETIIGSVKKDSLDATISKNFVSYYSNAVDIIIDKTQ